MGRTMEGWKTFAQLVNGNEETKKLMAGWDKVIQFVAVGEGDFYVEIKGGVASFKEGKHASPNFTMKGPEEIFYKFLTQEVDPTKAFLSKQYTIEGSLGDAMKFGRIGQVLAKTEQAKRAIEAATGGKL